MQIKFTDVTMTTKESRRLFIGGMTKAVSEDELKEKFSRFGDINGIEIKTRQNGSGILYTYYLLFIEVEGGIDIYGSVESGAERSSRLIHKCQYPETEVNNYFVHLQHKKPIITPNKKCQLFKKTFSVVTER